MKKILLIFILSLFFTANSYAMDSLKIGSDEWEPFHRKALDGYHVEGFTADVIRAVLASMNVNIEDHRIYPWKRACKMVFEGDLDAVFTTTKTKERMGYCYFPLEPITDFSYVLFIRKSDENKLKYDTFEDLKNHKIGTVRGFSYTEEFTQFIEKEQNAEAVTVGVTNFKRLVHGMVDYVIAPKRVGYSNMHKLEIEKDCIALPKPIMSDYLYIMFSKKNSRSSFC